MKEQNFHKTRCLLPEFKSGRSHGVGIQSAAFLLCAPTFVPVVHVTEPYFACCEIDSEDVTSDENCGGSRVPQWLGICGWVAVFFGTPDVNKHTACNSRGIASQVAPEKTVAEDQSHPGQIADMFEPVWLKQLGKFNAGGKDCGAHCNAVG